MLIINERFKAERDTHGWKLHQLMPVKGKDGSSKERHHTTYHPNLKQICGAVIDREAGMMESLEELKDMLTAASEVLAGSVTNTNQ